MALKETVSSGASPRPAAAHPVAALGSAWEKPQGRVGPVRAGERAGRP